MAPVDNLNNEFKLNAMTREFQLRPVYNVINVATKVPDYRKVTYADEYFSDTCFDDVFTCTGCAGTAKSG